MSKKIIYRARAPLRLGLAGGGTDVSPYSEIHGGSVLNATISMFAYATIEPRNDGKIVLESIDLNERFETKSVSKLKIDNKLSLLKGTYNKIVERFAKNSLSFKLTTYCDAPQGTGLGSSSTMVVAIVGAFTEWLSLPLGQYDIAHISYEIERIDLKLKGGKQDQYAATFGGFNFMEFYSDDRVIVNPLRIESKIIRELEVNLVLYYMGVSRFSSEIIEAQSDLNSEAAKLSIEAMHSLKHRAIEMKEAILTSNLSRFGKLLDLGWQSKKKTSNLVTNNKIDEIYDYALSSGAIGGKISGAGGGGFFVFYCPGNVRYDLIEPLAAKFGGEFRRFTFTDYGLKKWTTTY